MKPNNLKIRNSFIVYALTFFTMLTGCTTIRVLSGEKSYKEEYQQWYVSVDESSVVVVGAWNYYIFDMPEKLKLGLDYSSYLKIFKFQIMMVQSDDSEKGQYYLYLNGSLPQKDKQTALLAGFAGNYSGGGVGVTDSLSGRRYVGTPPPAGRCTGQFSQSKVRIEERLSPTMRRIGYLAVPFAAAVDILLLPVYLYTSNAWWKEGGSDGVQVELQVTCKNEEL